jgi:hypothetical protein
VFQDYSVDEEVASAGSAPQDVAIGLVEKMSRGPSTSHPSPKILIFVILPGLACALISVDAPQCFFLSYAWEATPSQLGGYGVDLEQLDQIIAKPSGLTGFLTFDEIDRRVKTLNNGRCTDHRVNPGNGPRIEIWPIMSDRNRRLRQGGS